MDDVKGLCEVKPLRWVKSRSCKDDRQANTDLGQYCAGLVHGSFIALRRHIQDGQMHDDVLARGLGIEDAKAAAQADYEQRILSALTPATALTSLSRELAEARAERDEWRKQASALQLDAVSELMRANDAESSSASKDERIMELELKARGADAVISAIERAIPDWRSYRDLIDAVECKLSEARS